MAQQHSVHELHGGESHVAFAYGTVAHAALQVGVAKGCLATSTMSGHGLSIATAGIACSFTVTVRDSFGNLRSTGTDFTLSSSIVSDNLPSYVVNVNQPSVNRFSKQARAGDV
jgi:hypothetical protein